MKTENMRKGLKKLLTVKNLSKIATIILWAVYIWIIGVVWTVNADVMTGDALLEPDMVFSNSQLTAYLSTIYTTLSTALMLYLVTYILCPSWTVRGRMRIAEMRIEMLEKRIMELEDMTDKNMESEDDAENN